MTQKQITERILNDLPTITESLFPNERKNFHLATKIASFSVLHFKPSQVRSFITDFIIRTTKQFDLMKDYMSYAVMVRDFLAKVQDNVYRAQGYQSEWYEALNINITEDLINYMKEECEYFDEIPLWSMQDVENAARCKRATVYNYIHALNVPKYGEGKNCFKKRDFERLVLAISTRNKNL